MLYLKLCLSMFIYFHFLGSVYVKWNYLYSLVYSNSKKKKKTPQKTDICPYGK